MNYWIGFTFFQYVICLKVLISPSNEGYFQKIEAFATAAEDSYSEEHCLNTVSD